MQGTAFSVLALLVDNEVLSFLIDIFIPLFLKEVLDSRSYHCVQLKSRLFKEQSILR